MNDILNQRFGRLVVLCCLPKTKTYRRFKYKCHCDCGTIKITNRSALLSGGSKSCGCLRRERIINMNRIHGLSDSKEHRLYLRIKERCYNSRNDSYKSYGARGIRLCSGWNTSFESFYEDIVSNIGHKPSKEFSIDRINNNLNYSCGHCNECKKNNWPFNVRWATALQQANNKRRNHFLTLNNETLTIAQWSRKLKLNSQTLICRIKRGWSIEAALTKPIDKKHYRKY